MAGDHSIGQFPVPQWLREVGMLTPTDPVFVGYSVSPKRVSAILVVSDQIIAATDPAPSLTGS
jgi:hypothetical protein